LLRGITATAYTPCGRLFSKKKCVCDAVAARLALCCLVMLHSRRFETLALELKGAGL